MEKAKINIKDIKRTGEVDKTKTINIIIYFLRQ